MERKAPVHFIFHAFKRVGYKDQPKTEEDLVGPEANRWESFMLTEVEKISDIAC